MAHKENSKIEDVLSELGNFFDIKWEKSRKGIKYLPLILLNRSKTAIYNRDYFSARRILKSYEKLEDVLHSENIPHDEEIHSEFENQKKILKFLKKTGHYFENGLKTKRSYE